MIGPLSILRKPNGLKKQFIRKVDKHENGSGLTVKLLLGFVSYSYVYILNRALKYPGRIEF